jgi:hypothetical protein
MVLHPAVRYSSQYPLALLLLEELSFCEEGTERK